MALLTGHLQALLPGPGLRLEGIDRDCNLIYIVVSSVHSHAACPLCRKVSSRVHSRYERTVRDLPWHGTTVRLKVRCRRFYCRSGDCSRKIFAERLPKVVSHYGRHTTRVGETLAIIGHALGGEAGFRLADRIALESSADTILRIIKRLPLPTAAQVRVLGVDDWAWKRGQRYGTILVDLERRCPVDLLPDRSANSFEDWLLRHPGIEVIARDRASLYSQGATAGAPEAIQVADRFHLICNLSHAVERALQSKRLQAPPETPATIVEHPTRDLPPDPTPPNQAQLQKQHRRKQRLERYAEVVRLHSEGHSQRAIGQIMGLSRKTVRRFLKAGQFPERAVRARRPSCLDPYRAYIEQRWKEGCHNATQLWHEIQQSGYTGGRVLVSNLVAQFRTPETKYFRKVAPPKKPKLVQILSAPRQLASMLVRRPENLSAQDQHKLGRIEAVNPLVSDLRSLVQDFSRLMRDRNAAGLSRWQEIAIGSCIPAISQFAKGIERDRAAVDAAFTLPWSSGQVEGQVHRLKLIKRQMYGRAGFQLLRTRLLPFPPTPVQNSS